MNNKIESVLKLKDLGFDRLEFERLGQKNNNNVDINLEVEIGCDTDAGLYKTILKLKAVKKDEYEAEIRAYGVFWFSSSEELDENFKKTLIQKNSVSIMMPYVRSQLTLLTSQPGVDPVVVPPFNVNAMLDGDKK